MSSPFKLLTHYPEDDTWRDDGKVVHLGSSHYNDEGNNADGTRRENPGGYDAVASLRSKDSTTHIALCWTATLS
jgi:hypothetical protein